MNPFFTRQSFSQLLTITFFLLFFSHFSFGQICSNRATDSLSLVQLYNATDGANWGTKWDLSQPLDTWHGVEATAEGCVTALNLTSNNLKDTLPDLNLQVVTHIYLGGNQLSGNIPDFSNLPNLIDLQIWRNELEGTLPNFSKLPLLRTLNLSNNKITGILHDFTNMPNLEKLLLGGNELSGNIPDFSNLSNLIKLSIWGNKLEGTLPNFSALPLLNSLDLSSNKITGTLPNFTNTSNLAELHLGGNQLNGNIPDFSNLPNLRQLSIWGNALEGALPDFTNTPNLVQLYLSGNNLMGTVPNFTNLPKLQFLGLREMSKLQLPKFTDLPELIELDIRYSGFSFDDILPNLNVPSDTFKIGTQNLYCEPNPIIIRGTIGETVTLDLMVDDTVTTNIYQWYKEDVLMTNAPNANTLEITNFQDNDKGIYKAIITNPNAPHGSIVNSCTYSVAIKLANDDVCEATMLTLGQRDSSSFLGATVQINEVYAPGKDCAVNWCDTILFGSLWYKFIAPANAAVNIVVNAQTDHSDTKIALYSGIDCTSENPFQNTVLIDANDDKPGNCCDGSIIAVACLTPGATYFVQVDQFHAGQNDFNITVNALESCELACDLTLDEIKISQDSCNGNGGYISTKVISPSGQLFMTELLDETGNPIDTSDHGAFFGHLNAGSYRIRATSLEVENCTIESALIEIIATCEEEGCAPNLVIDVIEKELYHAKQTIISTATLSAGHTATFKAGTSITLKTGFHAAGTFAAVIEDCEATLVEESVVESRIALNNTPVLKQTVEMKIFPNPFYEVTTIAYELPNKGVVTLQVFDFMGKEIAMLEQDILKEKGRYEINFHANELVSGTYFVVLQSGEYYEVQKLVALSKG